jgi:flagellar basal-body rod protein FlgF
VQGPTGEAYTRAGAMTLDETGTLKINGNTVLGEGGPIVPEYTKIEIGTDGTVSIQAPKARPSCRPSTSCAWSRPKASELTKNEAGLLVARAASRWRTDRPCWCARPPGRQQRVGRGRNGRDHEFEPHV